MRHVIAEGTCHIRLEVSNSWGRGVGEEGGGTLPTCYLIEQVTPDAVLLTAWCTRTRTESVLISVICSSLHRFAWTLRYEHIHISLGDAFLLAT